MSHPAPLTGTVGHSSRAIYGQWSIGIVGVILTALVLVPWWPNFPSAGLDPSWRFALNEALAQGAVFGRDVVFTFGPLASVYTQNYHPATDHVMVLGSLVYALGLGATFLLAAWPRRGFLVLGLPIVIALGIHRDAGFMALPLVLLIGVVRCTLPRTSSWHTRVGVGAMICIVLGTCALAITPLIKGSFAATSGAAAALIAFTLVRYKARAAIWFCLLFVSTTVLAWVLVGQPLLALPHFFLAQGPIISGYTTAMSLHGSLLLVAIYGIACALILALFHFGMARAWGWRGHVVTLALAFTLFVSFKAGFVRQDGHMFIAVELLLFVGLLGLLVLRARYAIAAGLICSLAWGAIGNAMIPVGLPFIQDRLTQTWRTSWSGVQTRLYNPHVLPAQYESALATIRQQVPLPPTSGSTDIYPVELSGLLAQGRPWAGRPVFQSYSVYTPELNALNNGHLNSHQAPDTVLFSLQPIDERLPALDDSLSLRTLLTHYTAGEVFGRWLIMTRDDQAQHDHLTPGKTESRRAPFNTPIALPEKTPVWMALDIAPTFAGRVVNTIYKLPRLWIVLEMDNGEIVRHRYIPGAGSSGFIVSPYLSTSQDVRALQQKADNQRYVKSVAIESSSAMLWGKQFAVSITPMNVTVPRPPLLKVPTIP